MLDAIIGLVVAFAAGWGVCAMFASDRKAQAKIEAEIQAMHDKHRND